MFAYQIPVILIQEIYLHGIVYLTILVRGIIIANLKNNDMFISYHTDKELFLIKLRKALRSDFTLRDLPDYLSIISPYKSLKSFREEIITRLSDGKYRIGYYNKLNGRSLFYVHNEETGRYSDRVEMSYIALVRQLLKLPANGSDL